MNSCLVGLVFNSPDYDMFKVHEFGSDEERERGEREGRRLTESELLLGKVTTFVMFDAR